MEALISETLQIARERFKAFGFKERQIEQLLESGKRDLEKEIALLSRLIEDKEYDIQRVNQSLHAIKGLLYNMGNTAAGDLMVNLKSSIKNQESIDRIKTLIGV